MGTIVDTSKVTFCSTVGKIMTEREYREEWECKTCELQMHGQTQYDTRMSGVRHATNVKLKAEGMPLVGRRGGERNPNSNQQKVTIEEALKNTTQPLIGMGEITEEQSNKYDIPTLYACAMCNTKCDVNSIVGHLTGRKHRLNYLKKYHEDWSKGVMEKTEEAKAIPNTEEKREERNALLRSITEVLTEYARIIESESGQGEMKVIKDDSPPTYPPKKDASVRGGRGGKRAYDNSIGYPGPAKYGRGGRMERFIPDDDFSYGEDFSYGRAVPMLGDRPRLPPPHPPLPNEPMNLGVLLHRMLRVIDYDRIENEEELHMAMAVTDALSEQIIDFKRGFDFVRGMSGPPVRGGIRGRMRGGSKPMTSFF